VMMIAEKAADLILGNTPLAPEYPRGHAASAPVPDSVADVVGPGVIAR
jgi:hypothetical protein